MKKSKRKNLHAAHKRLWSWLAKNSEMEKNDWPEWKFWEKFLELPRGNFHSCFPCFVAGRRKEKRTSCKNCPICKNGNDGVNCLNEEFHRWCHTSGEEKIKLAKKIASLPWTGRKIFKKGGKI